ncbi:restriction endonuclease subunit S [Rhodopirellula sp. P2]|uniref:restriction endonuclease subunit S n=1 Tax=Rhodopirellula sp. P2 TaxID=2127060 RepID=UPI0023687D73|nr:restriction endonuclease subunit S [Rhodopirellula sp. P2]WDQ17451.1 restriction endonuclease subunit S [Rhodopirellula sp. P2]
MPHQLTSLGDIAEITNGVFIASSKLNESQGGLPVLSVRTLNRNSIDVNELDFVSRDKIDFDIERHLAATGDVLVASRSTNISTGIVPAKLEGAVFNSTLIGIRPHVDAIHPRLLVAWMQSGLGRSHFDTLSQSTTMQMNVTVKELSNLPVPLFTPSEQAVLVAALEASDVAYENAIRAATARRDIALQLVTDVLTGTTQINQKDN